MADQDDVRRIALSLPGARQDENRFSFTVENLLAGDPERFFTEPHYNGFPGVLVRLRKVTPAQLRKLLIDAWRCQAPRR